MPAVDVDRMPPAQAAAWRQLWRILLAPEPTEKTRAGDSLAANTDAGKTADTEVPAGRNHTADRSGEDG